MSGVTLLVTNRADTHLSLCPVGIFLGVDCDPFFFFKSSTCCFLVES